MTKIIATIEPESDLALISKADIVRLNIGKHDLNKWPEKMLLWPSAMYDIGQKLRIMVPNNQDRLISDRKRIKLKLEPDLTSISLNRKININNFYGLGNVVIRDGLILGSIKEIHNDYLLVDLVYTKDQQVPLHNAGINFPGAEFNRFYLADKDKYAVQKVLKQNIFMLALSNVEYPENILETVKEFIPFLTIIVPKIETKKGVENLEQIIELKKSMNIKMTIMLARGDLMNEVSAENFVFFEQKVINICQKTNTPLIAGTGLLLSMKFGPLPSRAEITALEFFLKQKVDYLMLSDETVPDAYNPEKTIEFLRGFINTRRN